MPKSVDDTFVRPVTGQAPVAPGDISIEGTPDFTGTPYVGPVDKTGATASLGLQGQARFDWVLKEGKPSTMKENGTDYDSWLQSLPEDPNDIPYTQLLRNAKANAQARDRLRARGLDPAKQPGIRPVGDQAKIGAPAPPQTPEQRALIQGATPGMPDGARKMAQIDAMQHKEVKGQSAMIKGLPVSEKDALGANPGAAIDPYVQKWVNGEELGLDTNSTKVATRSGAWVYVGNVADEAGGKGYTRPEYVHFQEAYGGLAAMPPDKIKAYQKTLGEAETGVASGEVQTLWDEAVKQGQRYALAGQKVELQFIFDSLIASKVAKSKAGGGGVGPLYAPLTAEDTAGATYYQAMMQILGDTSGVDSAKSKP